MAHIAIGGPPLCDLEITKEYFFHFAVRSFRNETARSTVNGMTERA
jgi:hypothetical protein